MVEFKCIHCGNCCSHLTASQGSYKWGLYLSPSEAKFFPQEYVSPLFKHDNTIFAYQVNVNVCPNLKDNRCIIYENRPLGCKTFPLISFDRIDIDLCNFAQEHKDTEWDFNTMIEERAAIEQQLAEIDSMPQATDLYIYNHKKWITHG